MVRLGAYADPGTGWLSPTDGGPEGDYDPRTGDALAAALDGRNRLYAGMLGKASQLAGIGQDIGDFAASFNPLFNAGMLVTGQKASGRKAGFWDKVGAALSLVPGGAVEGTAENIGKAVGNIRDLAKAKYAGLLKPTGGEGQTIALGYGTYLEEFRQHINGISWQKGKPSATGEGFGASWADFVSAANNENNSLHFILTYNSPGDSMAALEKHRYLPHAIKRGMSHAERGFPLSGYITDAELAFLSMNPNLAERVRFWIRDQGKFQRVYPVFP